jgi:hypothetical protein
MKKAWKSWVEWISAVVVVPSDPVFVWSFSSHFIDFEGSLCSEVFSFHIPRLAFVPSIAWPWLCECRRLLWLLAWWAAHAQSAQNLRADIDLNNDNNDHKTAAYFVVNKVRYMKHHFWCQNEIWLCECRRFLSGLGMMYYKCSKWAKREGGYLNNNKKDWKNKNLPLLSMKLATQCCGFDENESCSLGVDAFRMEMALFDAIFRPVQKTEHNSFKNTCRSLGTGLPPTKCMKC